MRRRVCLHVFRLCACARSLISVIFVHCLIYCSEAAVAVWDPLHLSPYLNGISTAPTPSAISHFNDWINDCVCGYAHVRCFSFSRLPALLFVESKHQQYLFPCVGALIDVLVTADY